MEKVVKELDNMYGMGFARLWVNTETGLYRGTCSNGNSTRSTESMSECLRELSGLDTSSLAITNNSASY